MTKFMQASALLFTVISSGACAPTHVVSTAQVYDPVDSVQQYTQRADKVTLSAGNAQEVNSRIHVIDPWPRNVGNTRLTADGERTADAVFRYRCGKQPPLQPLEPTPTTGTREQVTTTASVGAGRPGSECSSAQSQGGAGARQ